MTAPPKTVLTVSAQEAGDIRAAVREARGIETLGPYRAPAQASHVAALTALLADPRVSSPIYTLPQPITQTSVAAWVADFERARACGEGLLIVNQDADGDVVGYTDAHVWPDCASGEIGGALRADLQGSGAGGAGAVRTFDWMFESLGVRLMCLTAARDNVRSQKLIDAAGFVRMGGRDGVRPDGTVRASVYWEMTRDAWRARWGK